MQGAPGCALDGFIRNTVVDLCDIETIQGELQHLTPLCKEQKYLGARGEKNICECFTVPGTSRHRALSPQRRASHATHVGVNFCSSENGTTHFPVQAGEDISLRLVRLRAEGCRAR